MIVQVLREFIDVDVKRCPGEVYSITRARYEKIRAHGPFVKEIEDTAEDETTSVADTRDTRSYEAPAYGDYTVSELKDLLDDRGVLYKASDNKAELIELLKVDDAESEA